MKNSTVYKVIYYLFINFFKFHILGAQISKKIELIVYDIYLLIIQLHPIMNTSSSFRYPTESSALSKATQALAWANPNNAHSVVLGNLESSAASLTLLPFFENIFASKDEAPPVEMYNMVGGFLLRTLGPGGITSILPLLKFLESTSVPSRSLIAQAKTISQPPPGLISKINDLLPKLEGKDELLGECFTLLTRSLGHMTKLPDKFDDMKTPTLDEVNKEVVLETIFDKGRVDEICNGLRSFHEEISQMYHSNSRMQSPQPRMMQSPRPMMRAPSSHRSESPSPMSRPMSREPQAVLNINPSPLPVLPLAPIEPEPEPEPEPKPVPEKKVVKVVKVVKPSNLNVSPEPTPSPIKKEKKDEDFLVVSRNSRRVLTPEEAEVKLNILDIEYSELRDKMFFKKKEKGSSKEDLQPFKAALAQLATPMISAINIMHPVEPVELDDDFKFSSDDPEAIMKIFDSRFTLDITIRNHTPIDDETGLSVHPLVLLSRWKNLTDDGFKDQSIILRNSGYSHKWGRRRNKNGEYEVTPFGWDYSDIDIPDAKGRIVNTRVVYVKPTSRNGSVLKGVFCVAIEGDSIEILDHTPILINNDFANPNRRYTRTTWAKACPVIVKDAFNSGTKYRRNRYYHVTGVEDYEDTTSVLVDCWSFN